MKFELFVAIRYLKARRKQAVVSLITVISIVGVAAGVAALIIALAINAGFREDLQKKLLGAQAHVTLLSRKREGLSDYIALVRRVEGVAGVRAAAPAVYAEVLLSSSSRQKGVVLKGIVPAEEARVSDLLENLQEGDLNAFRTDSIIIGRELANSLGATTGDRLRVMSAEIRVTPLGGVPRSLTFEVAGIFSSGLYDHDSSWAYVSIDSAQRLLALGDVASMIEVTVTDLDAARDIGQRIIGAVDADLEFTDWMTMNRSIFEALRLERLVMFVTIGLIVMVAALNIVVTLVMMVLEKTRDIAVLMSMGATHENIRRIFLLQGIVIGAVGTLIGLVLGNAVSYVADSYRLVHLAPDVYSIAYVPFRIGLVDSAIVAVSAVMVSFLATLYPSRAAAKLQPVEALRYE